MNQYAVMVVQRTLLLFAALSMIMPLVALAETPAQTLKKLQKGNQAFVDGKITHPNLSKERRLQLVSGQKPPAIIVSCSDSRVPPEFVFDQGLGDLFVVRVAGNIINKDNLASIEFAIANLNSHLILVLGHEACGAVGAAVNTPKGKSLGSASLDALAEAIRADIISGGMSIPATPVKASLDPFIRANVKGVMDGLTRRSAIIAEAVKSGKVLIVPAFYSLQTGGVSLLAYPPAATSK